MYDKRIYDAWFDASRNEKRKTSSASGIVKDPDGNIVIKYCIPLPYTKNSRALEYHSLIYLVKMLIEYKIYNADIRTDYKGLADSINKRGSSKYNKLLPNSKMNKIHQQAIEELRKLNYYILRWIPREENREADRLSKQAIAK